MSIDRREFLKFGGASLACACLNGIYLSGCSLGGGLSNTPFAPENSFMRKDNQLVVDLSLIPELNQTGGSVQLSIDSPDSEKAVKLILVHPSESIYKAFANVCSHRGKELEYVHLKRILQCSSGHSEFDLNGQVLDGNASSPLPVYPVDLKGNILLVYV